MSSETCPFCGKPFKRLNSHLPHCKMSPGYRTTKLTNKTKEVQTTPLKHTSHKNKTNKVDINNKMKSAVFQGNSKSKPKETEKLRMDKEGLANTFTSTSSKVASISRISTDTIKAKTKWLAKREQEVMKRAKLQTHTRIQFTQQEKHNSEKHKNPVQDTPLLEKGSKKCTDRNSNCTTLDPVQTVSWTTDSQVIQNMPKCKETVNIPELLTIECTLCSSVKKEQGVSLFKTKTCVWDHIKHGLLKSRYDCATLFPIVSVHNVSFTKCVNPSESEPKSHIENDQNTIMKTGRFRVLQTPVQRPNEDVLSSRLQNVPLLAYSPEMATGFGGTCFISSHSEISSNENVWMEGQTAKPSSQRQGPVPELRLADVKLNELGSYLGARTPKTPRDAVSMFNKGWQWYYRKYIDVRRGGIGGITMLIGGYCTLSYIWSYPHIKEHRWRKYH